MLKSNNTQIGCQSLIYEKDMSSSEKFFITQSSRQAGLRSFAAIGRGRSWRCLNFLLAFTLVVLPLYQLQAWVHVGYSHHWDGRDWLKYDHYATYNECRPPMLCDPNPTDHCIVVSSGMYPWTPTHRIPFGGDCKKIFTDDANLISELSITYDGNLVITAALDGKVEVFEAMTGSPVAELRTQKSQNYFVNNLRNNTQYLIVFLHDEGLTQNTFFITNDQLFLGGR